MRALRACSISLFLAVSAGDNRGDTGCFVQRPLHKTTRVHRAFRNNRGSLAILARDPPRLVAGEELGRTMSALPPKADIGGASTDVR